jgi:hypothetical protein
MLPTLKDGPLPLEDLASSLKKKPHAVRELARKLRSAALVSVSEGKYEAVPAAAPPPEAMLGAAMRTSAAPATPPGHQPFPGHPVQVTNTAQEPVPVLIVNLADLPPKPSAKFPNDCIVSPGDRVYRIGKSDPVEVSVSEDCLLQAFIDQPTMRLKTQANKTKLGEENSQRTLKRLTETHGGRFAPAIKMAGKKGQGGYHVHICRARPMPLDCP